MKPMGAPQKNIYKDDSPFRSLLISSVKKVTQARPENINVHVSNNIKRKVFMVY
tara:strand:- start:1191 stop:1352 length:162 start_codon:yes stop_codon:yes gene_type:complete